MARARIRLFVSHSLTRLGAIPISRFNNKEQNEVASNPPESTQGATKFCWNCGTQIPMEAAFCWKCGKAQKATTELDKSKWEFCQIEMEVINTLYDEISDWLIFLPHYSTHRFWAAAVGPTGRYSAGHAPQFKVRLGDPIQGKQCSAAFDSLINQLVRDGWESIETRGENWWNYRFKRLIR